jgi:hypothetical protein
MNIQYQLDLNKGRIESLQECWNIRNVFRSIAMILWAENQCSRNHFNTWSASTSCTDRLRYTAYDTQGNIKQSIIDLSDYCRRVFFKAQVRHSVKDVGCFAERYKATCRKYNQKFIIQTNSQWDAKPCSQGNVFRQRASTHHDDKDKVRSISCWHLRHCAEKCPRDLWLNVVSPLSFKIEGLILLLW